MTSKIIILIALVLFGFAFVYQGEGEKCIKDEEVSVPLMKGVCWVAGDSIAHHNIEQITDVGVNWISQTPFGWMQEFDSPVVKGNFDRAWWGESDRGIKHTTILAHKDGVKVMLKPHIWLHSEHGKWRQDIAMNSAEEWSQWFESYAAWILHYAVLAEECNIEVLCIGTELHQTTLQYPDKWKTIIKEIRNVYKGDLIYAANWYKEIDDIEFWSDLDYIGVQAYFPLSKKIPVEKKRLLKGWIKHKKNLKNLAKKYSKKIVFTEIGYKNTADAAREPWTWPQQLASEEITISNETQVVCYEAMFEALWNEPWFGGLFIWKWFHTTHKFENSDDYFTTWDEKKKAWAKKKGYKQWTQVYFTPQRTEALMTLKSWYESSN